MVKNEFKPSFQSHFAHELQRFLESKRTIGYSYCSEAHMLVRLDHYFLCKSITELNQETLVGWADKKETESVKTHSIRVSILRQFCLYLNDRGTEVPLPQHPKDSGYSKSFTPYIFTHQQIEELVQAADTMPIRRNNQNIARIMPPFLRLLYCSGLRLNEALSLRVEHFDRTRHTVTVLHGKNDNCRMIPLTTKLSCILETHLNDLYVVPKAENFIFPNPKMEQYSERTIYSAFRELLWRCGISHGGRGKGPRLHDLRHTFAVHSLQKLVMEGYDTYLLLPILSTYLGHKNIHSTERYLRLTAEVYPDILKKADEVTGGLIPEVCDYES